MGMDYKPVPLNFYQINHFKNRKINCKLYLQTYGILYKRLNNFDNKN